MSPICSVVTVLFSFKMSSLLTCPLLLLKLSIAHNMHTHFLCLAASCQYYQAPIHVHFLTNIYIFCRKPLLFTEHVNINIVLCLWIALHFFSNSLPEDRMCRHYIQRSSYWKTTVKSPNLAVQLFHLNYTLLSPTSIPIINWCGLNWVNGIKSQETRCIKVTFSGNTSVCFNSIYFPP